MSDDVLHVLRANYVMSGDLLPEDAIQEITRLRAEVKRLKQHITEIEQLHREHLEEVEAARGVLITDEQIDALWEMSESHSERSTTRAALAVLGIIECPECHGEGEVKDVITCSRCHGRGWIREERGDE